MTVDFNPIAFNTLTDKMSNTLDWECADRIQNIKFSALGSQGGTLWNKYELKVTQ